MSSIPPSISSVSSIYRKALGADFERLHPEIQKRFGFSSTDNVASIGRGIMEEVWHGSPITLPFLYVGTWRSIMFPEQGKSIPFTIENYAYRDDFGRETVTWVRTFETKPPRRFDAYMIYSDQRNCIVDYLGTHEHLAVDISLEVDENGGLRLHSGAQRFYEGIVGFTFPMQFSGVADVREWFEESENRFRIEVNVTNPRWGRLFGYKGWFEVEWKTVIPEEVPVSIKPVRHEIRE